MVDDQGRWRVMPNLETIATFGIGALLGYYLMAHFRRTGKVV
jgi:hypothetical protein